VNLAVPRTGRRHRVQYLNRTNRPGRTRCEDRRNCGRASDAAVGGTPPLASVTERLHVPIGERSTLDEKPSTIPYLVPVEVATPMV